MRVSATLFAAVSIVAAGCSSTSNAASPVPAPTLVPRPVVERDLDGMLLTPGEVTLMMGAQMTVTAAGDGHAENTMADNSAIMSPPECLAVDGAAEAVVYATSGFRAVRDQSFTDGDAFRHYVKQSVVLFPYRAPAEAFYAASVQQWPACHSYTHTQSGSQWTVGEIADTDQVLHTVATQQEAAAPGWACGRALALRNNVIVDVNTCSAAPGDSAVRIATEIGAKVLRQRG
jgi:hypothetical protein